MVKVLVQEPWALAEGESTTVFLNLMEMPPWLAANPSPSIVTKESGGPVDWDKATVGVTVKSASFRWDWAPAAAMTRRPLGVFGIITSTVHSPWESAETAVSVGLSPTVTVTFSWGAKPEPLIFKLVPGGPLERSRLKSAPRVSVRDGALPLGVRGPEAWTV